jgi:acyl-coenzyme A thioesterase PaaI-like protein
VSEDQEPPPRLCYACGSGNDRGLHMTFRRDGERTICEYTPCAYQQGYPGRMHGGVVSTLIDEAMGWAVYHAREWGATARLSVRYRHPVALEQTLRIEAWITKNRGRLMELRAEVLGGDGRLLAEGDGVFMKLEGEMAREMSGLARKTGRDDAPEAVT